MSPSQSLELSGLFLFLRFRDVHKKSQTGTRKRQLWGRVTFPHILQGVVAPNARKAHGYRHSRREAQEKACKLTDGGGLCLKVAPMRPSIR